MNAKTVLLAEPALKLWAHNKVNDIKELGNRLHISEQEACEIIEYLKQIGAADYTATLTTGFYGYMDFKLTAKGIEIAAGKRSLVDTYENISQMINVNAPVKNLVQVTGDSASVTQTIDNSNHSVLRVMIEQDEEITPEKKRNLLSILEKFNTLKEGGENAVDLLKSVAVISTKYIPLFFSLLS